MMSLERGFYEQGKAFEASGKIGKSGQSWAILIPAPPSEIYEKAINEGYIPNEDLYVESLSDEQNARLLKSSRFKIQLAQQGGDVNMSEFSSSRA